MSGFVELELQPALAAVLDRCGYSAQDALAREQVPAAVRGTNLVLAAPPAARYAVPAMAGMVGGLAAQGTRALVLCPETALEEWASVLLPLADAAGLPALLARQPARAARRLREGALRLLITTLDCALQLLSRSALKGEELGRVVLAWPELCDAEDALTALMQELPAASQRILIPAEPRPDHPLIERYARRALISGPLAAPASTAKVPVQTVLTPWARRGAALAALLEAEDPDNAAVWCLDRGAVDGVRDALPVGDATVHAGASPARAELIVAWDLPSPAMLTTLAGEGRLVLLMPPHAMRYVREVTAEQRPLRLRGAIDDARDLAFRRRERIGAELARQDLDGELLLLAPLFERHDAGLVAAALYRLWLRTPYADQPAPGGGPAAESAAAVGRVWVGIGRKDGAGPADIVGALTREVGVDASKIGRIEVRELFCLVEVPAMEAEAIAQALSGKTIRRRQITARVDRGRPSGGSRGPSAPAPRGRPARPKP
ncbi:MAG TPA: DbpA RNA binding domain-containing protein [Gemmatimonadales bacterium]|nr:DbpA RNA binding domain-containing protein [Gemmatimonadales bacterium]